MEFDHVFFLNDSSKHQQGDFISYAIEPRREHVPLRLLYSMQVRIQFCNRKKLNKSALIYTAQVFGN